MNEFDNKLFVIDKEAGPTSFDVVRAFRKASRIRKVGHTGTLDPLARGVLLLVTGRATRAVEHFMDLPKSYDFTIRLGMETTTLDAGGEVVNEVPCPDLAEDVILNVAKTFVGQYRSRPPAYSAVKHNGKRLYELARAGETPEVAERTVSIYDLEVVGIELPDVHCRVRCSRGTYVRALARDFGERLGLPAHLAGLARTAIGPFTMSGAFPSRRIFEKDLSGLKSLRLADALDFLPAIIIQKRAINAMFYGIRPVHSDETGTVGAVAESTALRIMDERGELIAIGNRAVHGGREGSSWVDAYRLFVEPQSLER